jgi:hypothetical protein
MKNKIKLLLVALVLVGSNMVFANHVSEASGDNGGWVDVPLTDTQLFDDSCEYRVMMPTSTTFLYPTIIRGVSVSFGVDGSGKWRAYRIDYEEKDKWYYNHYETVGTISKIEKRCTLPDTTPSGAIMLFKLSECPDGWNKWLMPEDMGTEDMGTTDRRHIFCEKS